MTPEEVAKLRTWYRMATDRGDAKVSRSQAQAELWNLLTCEGWQGPLDRIRMGEGVLPKLLDMAERCADYDRRLSEVMPADFKDWHDNLPREWPEVAAGTITNLRQREDWAIEQLERALERLGETERDLNSNGEA